QVMPMGPALYGEPAVQLRDMDAAGIDLALLSSSCFPSWMTLRAAGLVNDASADLQRHEPDRFMPMAHVPPFGEAGALAKLQRAGRDLGLLGVGITTNF